ncbi:hypothetical protein RvY_09931-1 [Ramazzottius varieornatus]|uniref:Uncharacterized protein n=1 Tax=Ramazzottius varieornatus TaxID=947166 RepID=A0A1D1VFJ6_RAMVA|nr:hypothetical protein RvY_09931-1 [Ramazzottius varieornatus]
MDNKLGRTMSSMTDLKQALKNSVPRIGRRKSSLAVPPNSGPTGTTDEEANAVISKIPHSPSANTLQSKEAENGATIRKASGESPDLGFSSYLVNYFGQNFKQAAMKAMADRQELERKAPSFTNSDTKGAMPNGISLSILHELARMAPKPAETDDQWDWQEVYIQTSTSGTTLRHQETNTPDPTSNLPSIGEKGRFSKASDPVTEATVAAKNQASRFSFPSQLASKA